MAKTTLPGAETRLILRRDRPPLWLVGSYHPSQQNTHTGRLTRPMLDAVMRRAVELADLEAAGNGTNARSA